jgi:hypothetical protein
MTFYDLSVQKVMNKRFTSDLTNPLLVLRYVDALGRFSGEEAKEILPEVLRFYGEDKMFVANLISAVTTYYCIEESKKNLRRLIFDRWVWWFDRKKRPDVSKPWSGYRVLGWKEIPARDPRMSKYLAASIENEVSAMKRRVEELDSKWNAHIVSLKTFDEEHWKLQPDLIRSGHSR